MDIRMFLIAFCKLHADGGLKRTPLLGRIAASWRLRKTCEDIRVALSETALWHGGRGSDSMRSHAPVTGVSEFSKRQSNR
jgi:hypothetical protein